MLFEIADGAHDLGSVEGVNLARKDNEVGGGRPPGGFSHLRAPPPAGAGGWRGGGG